MLKSKFIDVIRTFSKDELKEFRDFVYSPFHNSNKNVIKIFELIKKHSPDYTTDLIDKEKLFNKIYPGKKYNDTVIRILLSDLLRLSEEYLALKRARKYRFGDNLSLLEELRDRGLDSLYHTNYKDTLNILSEIDDTRTKYFSIFELEVVNVDFHLRRDKQQQISSNVLNRVENLVYFMLIEIVRNIQDLVINENTFNAKFDFNIAYEFVKHFDFKAILEKLKQHRPEHYPLMLIYYNLLNTLMKEEDEAAYDRLKTSMESYFSRMSKEEIGRLTHYLESCCLLRMKHNLEKYRKEIFHVYELMLEYGVYSFGTDEMNAQRFKNIFIAAININDINWAEKFIEKYTVKVQPEYRESMRYYSRALIKFIKKDFNGALADLNKVKNDYFILKMDIKSWSLKIYYELNYFEQAFSFIDSYRHFLSKNISISPVLKERHLSFLKFTSELMRLKSKADNISLQNITHDLSNNNNVVHKDWINEKIKELESPGK